MPTSDASASSNAPLSEQDEPIYLAVGQLRHPHGVQGEMLMAVLTDFPERLRPGKRLLVGEQREEIILRSARTHARGLLVSFQGYDSPESVGRFRNQYVFVKAAEVPPLPEGEYYHHQLIGLRVIAEDDQPLGILTEILETGANDVYVVKDENGSELLLPSIPTVVLKVDLGRGEMRVHLLPGLRGEE